jgi:hypothetical protein
MACATPCKGSLDENNAVELCETDIHNGSLNKMRLLFRSVLLMLLLRSYDARHESPHFRDTVISKETSDVKHDVSISGCSVAPAL